MSKHSGNGAKASRREELDEKRAEAGRARKGKLILASVLVIVIVVIAGGMYFAMNSRPQHTGYQPTTQAQMTSQNNITVPLSEVSTAAKFYSYDSSGVTVRFFVVRGGDGQVHAATDACDVCYPAKKGYQQTGEVMTCNNCGKTFAINRLGSENTAGGCWPSHLPMRIDGNNVLVSKADLDAKRAMFS